MSSLTPFTSFTFSLRAGQHYRHCSRLVHIDKRVITHPSVLNPATDTHRVADLSASGDDTATAGGKQGDAVRRVHDMATYAHASKQPSLQIPARLLRLAQ